MKTIASILVLIASTIATPVKTKTATFFDNVLILTANFIDRKKLIRAEVRLPAIYWLADRPRPRSGRRNSRWRLVLPGILLR